MTGITDDLVAGKFDDQPTEVRDRLRAIANDRSLDEDERQARAREILGYGEPSSNGQRDVLAAPDGRHLTDTGNAARLVELAEGRIRYVHSWGKWIVYDGGIWIIDDNDALVTELAKRVAQALLRMVATPDLDSDDRKRLLAWAQRSESAAGIAAMVKLARGIPGVIVEHEALDANPLLLNVPNGTVDLRTGELRDHDPGDLCTLVTTVRYDPDADAPTWRKCLERWQPDATIREYLRLEAGAAATGNPTETVSVHHGHGANGKSRYGGAVYEVLGGYAITPHKSLLVTQRHEQHETVRAELFRKRFALAAETKAADALDEEQVKSLTGGDRLRGRRMREDPWAFWPSHTLVLFSNYRPKINGRDESVWRRLRLVPWEITIPEDERDEHLADKLRAEGAGILAWIVEGARRYLADGFAPPDAVRDATARYRNDEDIVGRFIDECLRIGEGWCWSADITAEAERWARDQGLDPPSMGAIAEVVKAAGCTSKRTTIAGRRGTQWNGLTIPETVTAS